MSSLSDHFALNTTLRNFCFLAHKHYFTKKHSRFNFMLMSTHLGRVAFDFRTTPPHIAALTDFKSLYLLFFSFVSLIFSHFYTVRALFTSFSLYTTHWHRGLEMLYCSALCSKADLSQTCLRPHAPDKDDHNSTSVLHRTISCTRL